MNNSIKVFNITINVQTLSFTLRSVYHTLGNMEFDLEFPYLYEDKEDYYTNIDYTSDITFGKYCHEPHTQACSPNIILLYYIIVDIHVHYLFSIYSSTSKSFRSFSIFLYGSQLKWHLSIGTITFLSFLGVT